MNGIGVLELVMQILTFLGVGYVVFVKSYFQEKGKNLATREDIEKITSLVENVKNELQYTLKAKLVLKREEHDALLEYYTQLYTWVQSIIFFNFTGVTYDSLGILDERFVYLTSLSQNTNMGLAKVEVLVDDDDFAVKGQKLIVEIFEFQNMTLKMIGKYKQICMNSHLAELNGHNIDNEVNEKIQRALQEFYDGQRLAYLKLLTFIIPHREAVSELLKRIVGEK